MFDDLLREVQSAEQLTVEEALALARRANIALFESELRVLASLDLLEEQSAMQRLLSRVSPEARVLLDVILAKLVQ
jgi:hypothetical protein